MELEHYPFTHNGNADRFWSKNKGEVLVYKTVKTTSFYSVGPDKRWNHNVGAYAGDVERRARDVISAMRKRAVVLGDDGEKLSKWAHSSDNLASMHQMFLGACLSYNAVVDPDIAFDQNIRLLATPDGVIELPMKKGDALQTREISVDDMLTMSTGVVYRPEAAEEICPEMQDYYETFMPDSDRQRLVFKALGSALLGGNVSRSLIILQGKTTTGKSQLVAAIDKALGDYAGAGNPSIFRGNMDDKARPDIIKLLNVRMAFLLEASKAWELHGDRVKLMTGGDTIPLRQMYSSNFIDVKPQFTPVVVTNAMPRIIHADKALRRRMIVIDFNRTPQKEDLHVKARFLASVAVREHLLARLVGGYLQSLEEGLDDVLRAFAELADEAYQGTSHMGEFFSWMDDSDQITIVDLADRETYGIKSKYCSLRQMHDRYMYWIKQHGSLQDKREALGYREFNQQIRETRGWAQIQSGCQRWEGVILADIFPTA